MHSGRTFKNLTNVLKDTTDSHLATGPDTARPRETKTTPAVNQEPVLDAPINTDTQNKETSYSLPMLLFVLLIAPAFHFFVLSPRQLGPQSPSFAFALSHSFGATTFMGLIAAILVLPFFYLVRLVRRIRPVTSGTSLVVLRVSCALIIMSLAAQTYSAFRGPDPAVPPSHSSPNVPAKSAPLVDKTNYSLEGNLYRNHTYKFRIKFPEGFTLLEGDGPNVLVKATDGEWAVINIVVQIAASPRERNTITANSISEMVSGLQSFYKDSFALLDSGLTKVSNEQALFVKYNAAYSHISGTVNQTLLQYVVVDGDLTYTITCGAVQEEYDRYEQIFLQTVSTFILESRLY